MQVKFKFSPMQHVIIVAYGLDCAGRVIRCVVDSRDIKIYDVEYGLNNAINRREFFEDELTEIDI